MGWLQRVQSQSSIEPVHPGLPRKVLHYLLVSHDFAVGSRILDVGCGRGELVRFLDQLGFDATGFDASREKIAAARAAGSSAPRRSSCAPGSDPVPGPLTESPVAARRARGRVEYRCGRVETLAPLYEHEFDMVLVRDADIYRTDLLAASALQATAHLLSCVRPGGLLAILIRNEGASVRGNRGHLISCYEQHLDAFPGEGETAGLPDELYRSETWRSLLARGRRTGYVLATVRSPAEPLSREDWLHRAEQAAQAWERPCCLPIIEGHPDAERSAA